MTFQKASNTQMIRKLIVKRPSLKQHICDFYTGILWS